MVHRDVKPANIFVCRHGLEIDFVKVLDFGLVKAAGGSAAGADRLTSEGALAGTPAFLSPEMALGGDVDWRSDIYALGCVAYWLLTGMPVFEADTSLKLALEHVKTPPVAPSRRSGLPIPKELDDTILACLAKDPRDRPQTAQELSERLASLGLEQAWTRRRAELWWRDHAPASADPVEPDGAAHVARSA
jgi:serine/threonine-protein kinase